ncbi:Bug family tripartite tricarboxylate transporter substrate binding protein [Ramlibacter albus]|uniref:Tripartite tricarboxylate transporter substrate binding protein n=1 Tax=Ramlibacter albus TaxID=2079448 RepID=A0A923S315_9BURK|nr:tripartite tricarboxylate transporter substrate binding protein [Ramlibacter albus]MBC5765936.1 tripartite tricarboxylate transporter substrate binding protein [Ramlibacter albus]
MRKILLLALWLASCMAFAQGYPAKPIRLVVPFPPGGSSDLVARTMSPKLGELLGQQVIVDYKGGAAGSIGAAEVANAPADGYTLLLVWDTHAMNHHVYKTQYDFQKSFEPITQLVQAPGMIAAKTGFGPSTVKELIDYARANPEKVTYGSTGSGSSNHVSAANFADVTGVKLMHVPYKGGGPMITDLLGGHVDIVFGTMPLFEQHVRSGKMKAIAVLSKNRVPQLPGVPTVAETVPGFEANTWFGLLAPAGTPKPVLARIHRDVVRALNDDKVREQFAARGFEVVGSAPEAFAAFLNEQSDANGRIVRKLGIKGE